MSVQSVAVGERPAARPAERLQAGLVFGRHWTTWLQVGSLVAATVALGIASLWGDPEAVATALLGLAVGYVLARYAFGRADARFVVTLFLVAFCLRLALTVALHWVLIARGMNGFLLMDDRAYDKLGWTLARVWMGIFPGIRDSDEYLLVNYTYLVAAVFYVFGHNLLAAKMLNVLFGALTGLVMYATAAELFNRRAARVVALLVAFWPSLLIWSAINLKDTLAMLLVAVAIYGTLVYARRHAWWAFVVAIGGLLAMENLRQFVYLILAWLLPPAFLLADRSAWKQKLLLFLPLAMAVFVTFQVTHNSKFGLNWFTPKALTNAEWKRWLETQRAESGLEADFEKPRKEFEGEIIERTLPYVPRGVFYVMMAPLPWEARSGNSRAASPEMLVWYGMLAAAVVGLAASLRERWRDLFLPLAFTAGWVLALALTEGNAGNIFRHRAQFMPYVLLLSSVGLVWLWARYRDRLPLLRKGAA